MFEDLPPHNFTVRLKQESRLTYSLSFKARQSKTLASLFTGERRSLQRAIWRSQKREEKLLAALEKHYCLI
ncbi:MAG: hypothetical protein HC890_14775 [Chloroflexaceae bacterium]|nr:hypothetical protein [Chloroflexaceae bacterium]